MNNKIKEGAMEDSRGIPKCRDSPNETPTAAERLAMEAAKDAGWRIHWPRIRMMSQSPELNQSASDTDGGQAENGQSTQPASGASGASGASSAVANSGGSAASGAWTQLMRFVAEITEVFGSPLFSVSVSEEDADADADADAHANADADVGEVEDDSFVELPLNGRASSSRKLSFVGSSTGDSVVDGEDGDEDEGRESHSPSAAASLALCAQRLSAEEFARKHPLLVLFLGWLVMVVIDWMVTSAAVPRLLSAVTLRPWSPFSESFVLRASLVSVDPTRSGLWQAMRSHLALAELWIDDSLWRMQTLATVALVPLTRPYSMQWLVFCALSTHALKRYSRLGARAMALCILYFVLADLSLWRAFAPSSARLTDTGFPDMGPAAYTSPSYECLSDACRIPASRATPPPPPPPNAMGSADDGSISTALDGVVFPHDVRSPFAEAVEEALAQKRAMLERRSERIRGLQDWRKYHNTTLASGNSRILTMLATLSVYAYAGFQLRQPGIHTLRLAIFLFVVDMVGRYWVRWYWINVAEPCCRSAGASFSSGALPWAEWISKHTLDRELDSNGLGFVTVFAYLQHNMRNLLRASSCFLSRSSGPDPKAALSTTSESTCQPLSLPLQSTSVWGILLPVHVLSIFILVCFREIAFAVHNMRVWYKTVVRDRRRGPAIVSGKSAALSTRGVTVTTSSGGGGGGESTDLPASSVSEASKHGIVGAEHKTNAQYAPTIRSVLSSAGASAAYAHRICFLCLSGYCERCLLSMEIWPTAFAERCGASGSAGTGHGDSAGLANGSNEGGCLGNNGGSAHPSGSASVAASSSGSGGTKRKARSHGSATTRQQQGPQQGRASLVCDPLLEELDNGLPSLRDSLLNLGLLNPSLNTPLSSSSFGAMQLNAGASGKRGKTLDAWIVSSVAHCPCRTVHGVGPSSFVPKAMRAERAQRLCQQTSTGGFEPPVGTLLPLAQYVRELKGLGLVRPVDPSSVVSNEDPAASVFPMIFGRFTMPENPQAVAAANALLASSAASYAQLTQPSGHTPGGAPFLGAPSSLSSSSSSSSPPGVSGEAIRPSRILVKPTPLSNVRVPGSGTFRLRIEDIHSDDGSVMVSVSMTPVLAHLLLAHQKTASSASVCVPASLASSIASRNREILSSVSASSSAAAAASGAFSFAGSSVGAPAQKRSNSDVDPYLDYVRVLLPKADAVLRVDGVRWADFEFQGCLNQPLLIRGLLRDHLYSICLTICGMRSEELLVYLPSASIGAEAIKEKMAKRAEIEALLESLEDYRSRLQTAAQLHRKMKKDGPKQLQGCANDLTQTQKSVEKLVNEGPKLERRLAQLTDNLRELDAEIPAMQHQLEAVRQELMLINLAPTQVDEGTLSDTGSTSTQVPKPLKKYASAGNASTSVHLSGVSGFGVLPMLSDSGESRSHSTSPVDAQKAPTSSALDQALKKLRATEARYRRAQDEREEAIQELKAERVKWTGIHSQVLQSIGPVEKSIEPVERDLTSFRKKVDAGKKAETRLSMKLEKQTVSFSIPRFEEKKELDKRLSDLKKAIKAEEDKVNCLLQRSSFMNK
ncbi:hypothetical protein LPJ57_000352 [Coemansia sp. RSA 486]|nr:hypothetical protein LPJ57_000352 [Coemansia sp. RSA 486]KAJ2237641.1 hypothetical protein IWW45_000743 [Coemansia sp. RSA 485]